MTGSSIESARLTLEVMPGGLAICRLAAGAAIPGWLHPGPLTAVTWTDDELSIVTRDGDVPEGARASRGWRAFKVRGPLDFALTGILASLASPLAEAGISVFAISTYDTDYLLVQGAQLEAARALLAVPFEVVEGSEDRP